MKKLILILGLVISIVLVMSFVQNDTTDNQEMVAFPDGYRDWTHVKSVVVMESHSLYERFGGMHHIYANEKALASMKDGSTYEKGSVLIFDLRHEVVADSFIYEGSRRSVAVMIKDSVLFPETGGWGFEEFTKDDQRIRIVKDANNQCFSCHKTQKASDYIYSKYRD
ncbi:MAG: cytochrome P460 family protein [Psychroserpens sp.]|uniref:cytochrome P460 family protein n=1 Tax=Psychroserpens sp. TaxID=2020870 RepID=UPI003002D7F8